MPPPVVLDTNAFTTRGMLHWLATYRGAKILPIVAYVELGMHGVPRRTQEGYDGTLVGSGVTVEGLTTDQARQAIELGLAAGGFAQRSRDFLIGAHAASPPRVLVTNNLADFTFLGDRARTPAQVMSSPPR